MTDLPYKPTHTQLVDTVNDIILQTQQGIEAEQAIVDHFRPRFEACWGPGPNMRGEMTDHMLLDSPTAIRLRSEVLDREANVRRLNMELQTFCSIAELLAHPVVAAVSRGITGPYALTDADKARLKAMRDTPDNPASPHGTSGRLNAIKECRSLTRCLLKEAVDIVDAL